MNCNSNIAPVEQTLTTDHLSSSEDSAGLPSIITALALPHTKTVVAANGCRVTRSPAVTLYQFDRSTLLRRITAVLRENPDLSWNGWRVDETPEVHAFQRDQFTSDRVLEEIARALAFIAEHTQPLPCYRGRRSGHLWSYTLKHVAEEAAEGYVSTGSIIVAALAVGAGVKRCPGHRGCWIALRAKGGGVLRWPAKLGRQVVLRAQVIDEEADL